MSAQRHLPVPVSPPRQQLPIVVDADLQLRIDALAYRLLLSMPTRDGAPALLLFTSVRPGEGKTTLSTAVAASLSRLSGESVLLADAHAERPKLHALLGTDVFEPGLFDALRGDEVALASIRDGAGQPCTTVLPVGDQPDPSLLFREAAIANLRRAAKGYRMVVLDGGVSRLGGASLGQHVDGVVLVIDASRTRREVVQGGIAAMHLPPGRMIGAILNRRIRYIPRFFYRGL